MTTPNPQRTRPFPRLRPLLALWAAGLLFTGLPLTGCGGDEAHEIVDVRDVPAGKPAPRGLNLQQRLQYGHGDASNPHGDASRPAKPSWEHEAPPGWEPLPPAPMREFGYRVAGDPDAECTFSTSGGALPDNVNRWRKQMSLEPVEAAAVEALPRHPFLGRAAVLVELRGTYVGMRGEKNLADAKMLGLVAQLPETGAFLKMVGPAAVVDAERERFLDLARSVRIRIAPAEAPHGTTPVTPPPAAKPAFQWTAPEGWEKQPDKSMRLVSFRPKDAPGTEVYVTLLSGAAGGVEANVNLWASQVGGEALSAERLASLPRGRVLGAAATYVTIDGKPNADGGGNPESLMGMIVPFKDWTVFVKMRGPSAEVHAQEAAFRAFTESFRE